MRIKSPFPERVHYQNPGKFDFLNLQVKTCNFDLSVLQNGPSTYLIFVLQGFFRLAIWWIIPCLLVKITREVFRLMHLLKESTWRAVVVFIASIISWSYLTSIILASCTLFHLVCILQVIHFEDFGKLLERDMDPMLYLEEHMNLRYILLKISHRFRMFLLLLFSFVTASLFVVLFITTAYKGKITFANGGDIAVSIFIHWPFFTLYNNFLTRSTLLKSK